MSVKVPFLNRNLGLGGLVKKSLSSIGIKPCGECKKREKTLDELLTFTPRGKRNASRKI